jgi:tryptophan halogenase
MSVQEPVNNNFKYVIAGGGTAGWITALTIQRHYPETEVTLIESEEIGILGAGEGTVPDAVMSLDQLGIRVNDIVKYANGTLKNGIKFTNWNGDGKYFYNGFGYPNGVSCFYNSSINHSRTSFMVLEKIIAGEPLNDIEFSAIISENKTVPFLINSDINNKDSNPVMHFTNIGNFALHFDAVALAGWLKMVGKSRGIKVINGKIKKINTDIDGYITSLKVDSGETIQADFIFDCTGFKRLIIGNFYNSEWKSYKDFLPVNKAIAFTQDLDPNGRIPSYTEAIAMKYGWVWKIPVGSRYGCGYVFDKNQISEEDAKKEVDTLTGEDTEIRRTFSFEPGTYQRTWIKNCVALGLASGFVEPLEATAIWTITSSLKYFLNNVKGVFCKDEKQIKDYNNNVNTFNDNTLRFLYFHYLTKRNDTKFWTDFSNYTKTPEYIDYLYKNNKDVFYITNGSLASDNFLFESWLQVGVGNKFFNAEEAEKSLQSFRKGIRNSVYEPMRLKYLKNLKLTTGGAVDHGDFVRYLINN